MKVRFFSYILPILLFSLIWGAVEFLMPVVFIEAGLSVTTVSILFAISSGISLFLDIPSGKLSDRIGRERLIAYSMLISVVALIILYFFSSLISFTIASILIGVAYGLNWSPILAFVSDRIGDTDHGNVFGDFFTLNALGEAIAPIITVFIIVYASLTTPFLLLAAAALLCACIFIKLIKNKPNIYVDNKKEEVQGKIFSWKSSLLLIRKSTLANLFLFAIGFFVAFFWQSVWFTQPLIGFYEGSLMDSALIVAVFSLPNIIFSKFMGKLIDKVGERKVFFSSIVTVMVAFMVFYFSNILIGRLISIFVAAIGVLGVWLVLDVLVVKMNKKEERGEFFGILETVRDGSYTITPLFIGFTYKIIGLNGIFIVNAIVAFLLLIFGIHIFKKNILRA